MEIIERGKKQHECKKPSWFMRKVNHIEHGAVIQCVCEKKWIWDANYGSGFWREVWSR